LAIVLSVLLRYTDSDYPFGIFKLFILYMGGNKIGRGNTRILDTKMYVLIICFATGEPIAIARNKLALIRSNTLNYIQEGLHS